jgi:hypothetical protein
MQPVEIMNGIRYEVNEMRNGVFGLLEDRKL